MPPKAQKRTAAPKNQPQAKKTKVEAKPAPTKVAPAKVEDPKTKLFNHVRQGLAMCETLNDPTRSMLDMSLHLTIGCEAIKRSDLQSKMCSMYHKVFGEKLLMFREQLDSAKAFLDDRQDAKSKLIASKDAEQETLNQNIEVSNRAKEQLDEARTHLSDATTALNDAEHAKKQTIERLETAREEKKTLDEHVLSLTSTSLVNDQQQLKLLVNLATKLSCDQSLIAALPSVLCKETSSHGNFDKAIFDGFLEKLRSEAIKFEKTIKSELEPSVEGASSRVDELSKAKESAELNVAEMNDNYVKATEIVSNSRSSVNSATKAVKEFEPEVRQAQEKVNERQIEHDSFETNQLGSLKQLEEDAQPPPAPAVEAEQVVETEKEQPIVSETIKVVETEVIETPVVDAAVAGA